MNNSNANEILDSPNYFLSKIDSANECFELVQTTREIISNASFIDGRTALSSDRKVLISFDDAFSWQSTVDLSASNFIFHAAFCGSTLMARTLDVENKCLSYKEPQVLIELAQMKSSNHRLYKDKFYWDSLLSLVLKKLSASTNPVEKTVIKPSNWVNNIAMDLMLVGNHQKAILLGNKPKDYLIAVFRGGEKRIGQVHSFLRHFVKDKPGIAKIIEDLETSSENADAFHSKLALIAYLVQSREFSHLLKTLPDNQTLELQYADLVDAPVETALSSSSFFGLGLSSDEIEHSVNDNYRNHAKMVDRKFNDGSWQLLNKVVRSKYESEFSRALEWYSSTSKGLATE